MEIEKLLDLLAIILSVIAFLFSVWQFFIERNRCRKEATIHAFDVLEDTEAVIYVLALKENDINELVKRHTAGDKRIESEWKQLSEALPLIEHFAVGINSKVYDIDTLNSMAGNKIITMYYACNELIKYKRTGDGNERNYSEFEKMVNSLICIRKKHKQSIPQKDT